MCPKSSVIFRNAAVGYAGLEARRSLKGFDLGDGQPALLDLRFADDILLFAKSNAEAVSLLHDLATVLSQVGMTLNASKTVVLTNEARPPQHLQLPSGERSVILEHDSGILASIATRLKYFDKVVTTVACFAAGHRALYKNDLVNMELDFVHVLTQAVLYNMWRKHYFVQPVPGTGRLQLKVVVGRGGGAIFSSVQQWAMRKWRIVVEHAHCGIDLQDALPKLLGLRFADDILLFARTAHETIFLLESLLQEFAEVGLLLNSKKT